MNPTLVNILRILFAIFCIGFGMDKFLEFLPICSLTSHIPPSGMIGIGVLEIIIGLLLLLNKKVLWSLRLATAIMFGGLIMHLIKGTYDCGGALIGVIIGFILIYLYKKQISILS